MSRLFTRRAWCGAIVACAALVGAGLLQPAADAKPPKPPEPPPPPPPTVQYTMTLLNMPSDSTGCDVWDMNKWGDAVGTASKSNSEGSYTCPVAWLASEDGTTWTLDDTLGDTLAHLLLDRAGMWPPDEWVDESGNPVVVFGRKTFDNGTTTNLFINVTGINDNGQICGHISFTRQNGSTGELKSFLAAFRTVATLEAPTLLGPGDVEVAVAPDGYRSPYAHSINYSGDVAGDIARVADSMREAFVWPAGPNEIAPLPIQQQSGAPAVDCSARAINDNGVVAGWMHVSGPGYIHAFVYDPAIKEGNATLDLTLRGGASKDGVLYGCAWDVNDYDDVVGFTTNPASWCQQAFRYTDAGELVNLGFLTGKQLYAGGVASAINNQGQAVGMSYYVKTSTTTVFKQFLYTQECGMMDLWGLITNPQVEEADFNYSQQYDGSSLHISNCADGYTFGRICGRTYTSHRPYVLTPIPPSN